MTILVLAAIALAAWFAARGRLTTARAYRLIGGALALLALREGATGATAAAIVLGGIAAYLLWLGESDARATSSEATRARALLGLPDDADGPAIRAAYKRVAMAAHPDRGGDLAHMQALTAARDLLLRRAGAWAGR